MCCDGLTFFVENIVKFIEIISNLCNKVKLINVLLS